ncbi:glycosyltransferase [Ravibacter arvi]|uniref:Glycosyltransferase n=1 Tax=Ravibacter arvi TaxID=2051041 RepID=A0ABP8LVV1_9BACT
MAKELAPIVVFCYNRKDHLQQTIEALQLNVLAPESTLYIFSDGYRGERDRPQVGAVRQYLTSIAGFKKVSVSEAAQNLGLGKSVINGVTQVLALHKRVIVLEDDMLTTPDFLATMNELLDTYESRSDIFSVTGYAPPVRLPEDYDHDFYLAPRASSWGWGTWESSWRQADWGTENYRRLLKDPELKARFLAGGSDLWPMIYKQQHGITDSWAVRWCLSQAVSGAYGVYPVKSKVKNIGTDGSGTNFTFRTTAHDVGLTSERLLPDAGLMPDERVIRRFGAFYELPFYLKIKNRVKFGI